MRFVGKFTTDVKNVLSVINVLKEKKFWCQNENCNFVANTSSNLKKHVTKQDRQNIVLKKKTKKNKCPKCDQHFKVKDSVTQHLRIKDGENVEKRKPFVCEKCDKRFVTKQNMNIHINNNKKQCGQKN